MYEKQDNTWKRNSLKAVTEENRTALAIKFSFSQYN